MRVVHVINDLRVGGAERLVLDLVTAQRSQGLEASLLALASSDSFLQGEAESGPLSFKTLGGSIRSPVNVARLVGPLAGADIIHSHLFPAQLWTALAGFIGTRSGRRILTEHNTENRRRHGYFRAIDAFHYRAFDAIAAISPAAKSSLTQWLPNIASRVTVVPNGIEIERCRSGDGTKTSSIWPQTRLRLLTVGRLEPQKDVATALRALPLLPTCHLVVAGDGPLRPTLVHLAETMGVADQVTFLGRVSDIPNLLSSADIYVQSSAWEGFGIAALEAAAVGLPVVATDVPGLRETVGPGALLFHPGSAHGLAEAIRRLERDPSLRQQLGSVGRESAERFSMDECARRYGRLYGALLNVPRRRLGTVRLPEAM